MSDFFTSNEPVSKNAERRKERKLAKQGAAAIQAGQDAHDQQFVDRRVKQLQQTQDVPRNCQFAYLEEHHPELAEWLLGTPHIVADKSFDLHKNRAIFFLGLDRTHSFSTREKIPKANWALVINCLAQNKPVYPPLLVPYCLAVQEHMLSPTTFVDRETYIKIWMASPDEVRLFSRAESTRFYAQMRDLGAALPDIGLGTTDWGNVARDIGGALSEDLGEMSEEGNALTAQAEESVEGLQFLGVDDQSLTLDQRMAKQKAWITDVMNGLMRIACHSGGRDSEAVRQYDARYKSFQDSMKLRNLAYHMGFVDEYASYFLQR